MTAISVVVPTRDRPAFVRHALHSLIAQRFDDFEVIVADNGVAAECREEVKSFDDGRIRYMRASRPLTMHDNWEWACEAAAGDYVGVMIDKTLWLPSTMHTAMETAHRTADSADVVSWWESAFKLEDEEESLERGLYLPHPQEGRQPQSVDPEELLQRSLSFGVRRGYEGSEYYLGKICFGLYRRDLLESIRSRRGRVFPPISPDYTSRAFALESATNLVDAGIPLQMAFVSRTSNGARVARDPTWALTFLEQIDATLVDRLPIPGLYGSAHNMVAHDYGLVASDVRPIDHRNLTLRAREDLAAVTDWPTETVRREQYARLRAGERRAGLSPLARWRRSAEPRIRHAVSSARDRAALALSRLIGLLPRAVKDLARRVLGRWAPPREPLPSELVDMIPGSIPLARALDLAEERVGASPSKPPPLLSWN